MPYLSLAKDTTTRTTVPNVGFVHREVIEVLPYYQVVYDCLQGELIIKWRRERYLPMASRRNRSKESIDRYETILADAVYYNVVAAHADFMTGQVFMRPPAIKLPEKLKMMEKDIDGTGLSTTQLARKLVYDAICFSRFGLFVDYPSKELTTQYELDSGLVSPLIVGYRPWQIVNWRTERRGGKEVLVLVVLQEIESESTDGFNSVEYSQLRVLKLNENDEYEVCLYRSEVMSELARFGRYDYNYFDSRIGALPNNQGLYYTDFLASYPANYLADFRISSKYTLLNKYVPLANGVPLNQIPFIFGGAKFNKPSVERPLMFDIAGVNLGHYRDSSLNQQMLRYSGSGTPWFSGLNKQWINRVMGGKLSLGATAAIKLPTGGSAGMLQGAANSSIREAMQDKWSYMAALGARILSGQASTQKSATEFSLESGEFNSGLALIANNVGKALSDAFKIAGEFVGVADNDWLDEQNNEQPVVDLLTDYGLDRLSPQQRHQIMAEVQGRLLTWTEGREHLRKAGLAFQPDDEARVEIEEVGIPKNTSMMEQFQPSEDSEDENEDDPNVFEEDEEKKEDQQEADDGLPKDGEKAGPQDAPTRK